ncbi:MAG TPA: hypothetical protein VFO77_07205 [Actinoplanes sp.]|nr:hypothetical protein [Actinoplanes sp.]
MIAFAVATLTGASAANAAYPPVEPAASVTDSTVGAGGQTTFTGEGFDPGETIDISVSYSALSLGPLSQQFMSALPAALPIKRAIDLGSTTADEDGEFSFPVELTRVGTATLTAVGRTSGTTVTATVTVLASDADADDDTTDSLAVTGSDVARWASIGAAAVIVGAALVWFVYARGRREQPAGMPREHEPVA